MVSGFREEVTAEMRARLAVNRHGRLTADQWKDMVTEPLVILLLLMVPLILFLGPRLVVLTIRGILVISLVIVVVVVVPMLFRAYRYSRAPVHFSVLYAGADPVRGFVFWRPQVLYTREGQEIRFRKRLAPFVRLRPNRSYLVYYLKDGKQDVLLSLAPADHPEADRWQPDSAFHERFARRTGA